MDEIDLKLLRLLQKNARTPIKALAGEVRLSSPAVSARIERLEKQGVIRAYTLDLRDRKLLHADQGVVRLDAGAGRLYRTSAEIRQNRNTDCVFLAGAAESHCGIRKSLRVQAFFFYPQGGDRFEYSIRYSR